MFSLSQWGLVHCHRKYKLRQHRSWNNGRNQNLAINGKTRGFIMVTKATETVPKSSSSKFGERANITTNMRTNQTAIDSTKMK